MMHARQISRRAVRGFTLLELLLATAVGAIVLLVINATFFSALRLYNGTNDKIDHSLVVQRALGIVRKDLAGIMLPPNPQATTLSLSGQFSNDTYTMNALDSSAERISPDIYTSSGKIDGWTPYPETQMVSYFLAPSTDGNPNTRDLVRVVTRNLLAAAEPIIDNRTLLTGVTAASMSFLDGENWVDTWDSTTTSTLPSAIKFSVVIAPRETNLSRGDPAPTEIVVPVLVTTTTSAQIAAEAETAASL